ncbi:MAG: acid phosphatase type 7, partial [Actinomycetota bacterium]|nr:acid phosphatase type 7 [Actinomycetota bacterium]
MRQSTWRRTVAPVLGVSALVLLGLGGVGLRPAASSSAAPVLIAAGDIDGCGPGQATAKLAQGIDGTVAPLGDNAYPSGSASDYSHCYDPTWGQFKDRTHPVPGNHEYDTGNAAAYFHYFGDLAGPAGRGYYSYDVGPWHVVALDSNCGPADCGAEKTWLDADLSAHPAPCTLAYMHHPRFSSGAAGNNSSLNTFWDVLYAHRASVVLSGHDHDYERFAPQNPAGRRDPGRGIRQFVVGTGGGALGSLYSAAPNSEVRNNRSMGVLQLTLRADGYDWRFVPIGGGGFTDSGSDSCSGATPPTTSPATATTAPRPEPAAPGPAAVDTPPSTTAEPAPDAAPPSTASPSDGPPVRPGRSVAPDRSSKGPTSATRPAASRSASSVEPAAPATVAGPPST